MKKISLRPGEHGTSPAKQAPNVAKSVHKIVDGSKHVNKPLNAHRQQPGFKGKVQ